MSWFTSPPQSQNSRPSDAQIPGDEAVLETAGSQLRAAGRPVDCRRFVHGLAGRAQAASEASRNPRRRRPGVDRRPVPEPIAADQNAAAVLEKIAPRLDEFSKEYGKFFDTPLGKAYDAADDRGDPPTPEQISAIRAILDKYPDIDDALVAAAACPQYASLADFSVPPQVFLEECLTTEPPEPALRRGSTIGG